MKNTYLKLFTGSILLSSMLFTGCGGEVKTDNETSTSAIQPHSMSLRTTTTGDENTIDYADEWEKYVSMTSLYDRTDKDTHNFSLNILAQEGISSDVAHFQIFLDTDNNLATGLSIGEGAYAIQGADYMVEDGQLFKSTDNANWAWNYVGEFDYQTSEEAHNAYRIKLSSSKKEITSIINEDTVDQINVSIEPISAEWYDTHNFVSTQAIKLNIIGDKEVVVEPKPIVEPKPVVPTETVYENAENGLANWITIKGNDIATRKTPGYRNDSKAFVKLPNEWTQDENGQWHNSAEYNLPLNDTLHTMLSVDLVGDGTLVEHYVIGAKVTTTQGVRTLLWDSYYNHEGMSAARREYENGNVFIFFPSPVEMVRGYDYSDVTLSENFTVDLEAALKEFEPNAEILSVDTFVATGGNLDNIKLFSK